MKASMAFGYRIDRWLIKRGDRDGWLLGAIKLVTARRMASTPLARISDRRAGRRITAGSAWADYIPQSQGYRTFSPDIFPELSEIIEAGQATYDRHVAAMEDDKSFNKTFFYNILAADGLREHPIFLDFALSPAVTEAVTGYLGHRPRLNSIGVFYSPINNSIEGSQLYHTDGDGLSQVKIFINIWDVEPGGGGFTFVPKNLVSPDLRKRALHKKLSDEDVFQVVPEARQVILQGPPGSGAFVDTSRCLHQGSRARTSPRLVLTIQYVARPDALLPRPPGRAAHGGHHMITRRMLEDVHVSNPNATMFVE
jgi:hypothetical protein